MKSILVIYISLSLSFGSNFKNVQLLDFKSNKEMNKYMRSITKDLGVQCSHCHDLEDKPMDTKEKEIAREMIKLTRYLNDVLNTPNEKDYITFVTCWTCHRGSLHPDSKRSEEK